jgi:hypothetical protein
VKALGYALPMRIRHHWMDEALIARLEVGRLGGTELVANPASDVPSGDRRMSVRPFHHECFSRRTASNEERRSRLRRILDSNEVRLDRLASEGVPVSVDGLALLLFVLQRSLRSQAPDDNAMAWARSVEVWLNEVDGGTITCQCA